MAHGSHDQMEKKIQVSIFFFFKFGLVTQGPKVSAISLKQEGPAVHYYWGSIGNLVTVTGLGILHLGSPLILSNQWSIT